MKFLFSILYPLFLSVSLHAQPCNIKLSGHIEDEDVKEKLEKATVKIIELDKQILTDASGDFNFENICAGDYTIIVTHINCEPITKKIVLQKNLHIDIFMPHAQQTMGVVKVETLKALSNIGNKKELSGNALNQTRGLSLAESLSKINGVSILQTGSTIAKPVIHGLHGNRILTINNGVRQEGQQWGNEHAPEIDPFIADKLTIIRGVDELKYGSDAIGGVILIEPKALKNTPGYDAEINTVYFTNNKQYVASAIFETQVKKLPAFSYRLQGTFKRAANVSTPNYRLNNTGINEKNFSITGGYRKNKFNTELFFSYFNTNVGIFKGSHIGNLTDLQNAIERDKPNDIFLGENTYQIGRPNQSVTHQLIKSKTILYSGSNKFTVQLAAQFNHREEYDVVRSSTNTKPQLDLTIYTLSQNFSWETPKKNNFTSTTGASFSQQQNSTVGRYFIPNYFAYTFGGYYIKKWSKHKWDVHGALRYDYKNIATRRIKFSRDTIDYDFNFSSVASSLSALFKASNRWKFNSNISIANRAPHVNELLSDGIHHGTGTYDKGDVLLKQERAINITAGLNYENKKKTIAVDLLLYRKDIRNFIYQQPMPDKPVLTIAGAFPLLQYTQTNAVLSGFDVTVNIKPFKNTEWVVKAAVLQAKNKSINDWLILMPANNIQNEIIYRFNDFKKVSNTYFSVEIVSVGKQYNVPSNKNGKQDYKAAPNGYSQLNTYAAATFDAYKRPITINLGARNILNTVYRSYLNSMRYFTDEMGRNFNINLKIVI